MRTIRIPQFAGAEQTLAELLKALTDEGLTFEVSLVKGAWEWVIEITSNATNGRA